MSSLITRFVSFDEIPYHISTAIRAIFMENDYEFKSYVNFHKRLSLIKELSTKNELGIIPPQIHLWAKRVFQRNQQLRWFYKRILNQFLISHRHQKILNTNDLFENPIRHSPNRPSKRNLVLWDSQSQRSYLFTLNDILGILRSSILGTEVHAPKNPYTNIPFSIQQRARIHCFLLQNADRIKEYDTSILLYTRWSSTRIVYDYRYSTLNHIHTMTDADPSVEERSQSFSANILLNRLLPIQHIKPDKQPMCEEFRECILRHLAISNLYSVPPNVSSKISYLTNTIIEDSRNPGKRIHNWFWTNRRRYRIRYKQTENE